MAVNKVQRSENPIFESEAARNTESSTLSHPAMLAKYIE